MTNVQPNPKPVLTADAAYLAQKRREQAKQRTHNLLVGRIVLSSKRANDKRK